MHELAICQALLDQVRLLANREQATQVTAIRLRIGPLSGVEAALLINAFPLVAAGTLAEGAELTCDDAAVQVRCRDCRQEGEASLSCLLCPHCGGFHTQVIAGDELLLVSLEFERTPAKSAHPSHPRSDAHVR
ncbi:MAG: hydrogenase maturation nickel metallochaperone HypA [Pseudomonadota bacterium]